LIDSLDLSQQLLGGENVFFPIAGPGILIANDPSLVDNNVRTFGDASCFIQYPKSLHHVELPIAEKGIVELEEIGKGLLGEGRIGANPQNFSIFCLEFSVIVRTGRLQLCNSDGAKVREIEIDENILPPKAAELKLSPLGAL